jgi:hypothetical protein
MLEEQFIIHTNRLTELTPVTTPERCTWWRDRSERVPVFVEVEVAVPHLSPAEW